MRTSRVWTPPHPERLAPATHPALPTRPRVAWDGPTIVTNSVFSNNADQGATNNNPDNPAGVWVAPFHFAGFFTNNPNFTTAHSTYSYGDE